MGGRLARFMACALLALGAGASAKKYPGGLPERNRYEMPAGTRHGSMIDIRRKQYDAIVAAFPDGAAAK